MTEICPVCNKMMDRNDFRLDLSTMTECFKCGECGVSNSWNFFVNDSDDKFIWFLGKEKIGPDTNELIRAHKLRGFL